MMMKQPGNSLNGLALALAGAILAACGGNQPATPPLAATSTFNPAAGAGQRPLAGGAHAHLPRYSLKIIQPLPGGNEDKLTGLNDLGDAVGTSPTRRNFPEGCGTVNRCHAFLWHDGELADLGDRGRYTYTFVPENGAVNDKDEVAGILLTRRPDPNGESFCFTNEICRAFLWRKGLGKTYLPLPGGNNSMPSQINDQGVIVGFGENTVDHTCYPPQVLDFAAVVWGPHPREMHTLPPLSGDTEAGANGISSNGDYVGGASGTCAIGPAHAVVWQSGTPIELHSLGGQTGNIVFSVNNSGIAVGQSDLHGDGAHHAVLWKNGKVHDLGTLYTLPVSLANSINDQNQIVGFSQDLSGYNTVASLWQNGEQFNLNDLIPPHSDYFVVEALQINSRGQIATYGYRPSTGNIRGALLTPINGDQTSVRFTQSKATFLILPENVRAFMRNVGTPRFGRWFIR